MNDRVAVHPVQNNRVVGKPSVCAQVVTLKAYEVYAHVYGEQPAIVTGSCRGGFSAGELIVYLYAHSFPKSEWRMRVDEASNGMENL